MSSYPCMLVHAPFCLSNLLINNAQLLKITGIIRSAEKGKAIQDWYSGLHNRFDIAVVEDLVTGDLTEALKAWLILPMEVHLSCIKVQSPATYKEATKGDKPGIWVYCTLKVLTEKATFDYARQNPDLKITTITTINHKHHKMLM
ncbi:hypothetical protein PILCRDRAFT_89533 [Piloderma croceum F 1598]|uniref:Uncharacterized protein n=1 Tax=Piloderma croceum (strain F 1598) TaxID=765440 RepID=A0A0C3B2W6_PILCF|nr:hypothetical protein PILCRDRAFT_89533 [Piloderma croceum F 1598]